MPPNRWEFLWVLIVLGVLATVFLAAKGTPPRVCATVVGLTPIYSDADTCTYVHDYGLAKFRLKAQ